MNLTKALELRKARSHKYIRKEGKRYIYRESGKPKHKRELTDEQRLNITKDTRDHGFVRGTEVRIERTGKGESATYSIQKLDGSAVYQTISFFDNVKQAVEHAKKKGFNVVKKPDKVAVIKKAPLKGKEVRPGIFENPGEGGLVTVRSTNRDKLVSYIKEVTGDKLGAITSKIKKDGNAFKYTEAEDVDFDSDEFDQEEITKPEITMVDDWDSVPKKKQEQLVELYDRFQQSTNDDDRYKLSKLIDSIEKPYSKKLQNMDDINRKKGL